MTRPVRARGKSRSTANSQPRKAKKYEVVRGWIAERIVSGEIAAGARLPSEHDLMDKFGVSRITVRRALDQLRVEGLVESAQGRGYFARSLSMEVRADKLEGLGEVLRAKGLDVSSGSVERLREEPPADVAAVLGLGGGEGAVRLVRERQAAGTIICIEERWLPNPLGTLLYDDDRAIDDLVTWLEQEQGTEIGWSDELIEVSPAPAWISERLGIPPNGPIVRITQTILAADKAILCHGMRYFRADMFKFSVRAHRW